LGKVTRCTSNLLTKEKSSNAWIDKHCQQKKKVEGREKGGETSNLTFTVKSPLRRRLEGAKGEKRPKTLGVLREGGKR